MTRKNLQLVGVTGMLIASKYEEIWAPEARRLPRAASQQRTDNRLQSLQTVTRNLLSVV